MKALGIKNRCRIFEIPKTVDYIVAPPRMQTYVDISADIYGIYLKYIAKEDIHVYSIDEAFMDVTDYLALYRLSAKALGFRIMQDIYEQTGIRTMGDIASADENLLYHLFGVDAELLIDHAWGREPVTIADIKTYRPHTNSDRLLIPAVTALYEKIVNPE